MKKRLIERKEKSAEAVMEREEGRVGEREGGRGEKREKENLQMKRVQTVLENHCLHLVPQTDTGGPSATRILQLSSSSLHPSPLPPACPGLMDLSKDEAKLVCKLSE